MKTKFKLLIGIFISYAIAGCSNEELNLEAKQFFSSESATEISIDDVATNNINGEAKTYYSLLKTAIFATDSNLPHTRNVVPDNDQENPLIEKLEDIAISDEDGNPISFFSLEEKQQMEFLDEWVVLEADAMSEKLNINPELRDYVKEQNEIIGQVLQEETAQTRSGDYKVKNNNLFFQKIRERMNAKAKSYNSDASPNTRIGISGVTKVPTHTLKIELQRHARPGDFILALPVHNRPWIFLTAGSTPFNVGHSSVITDEVTTSHSDDFRFALGAQTGNGVTKERLSYWNVRCFIMGIQKVSWKWKWRGFKSRLYKVTQPVSNPSALAQRAESYRGREYVKWYEFLTAKWAAPSRFTCTTLILYCAKKEYGINVSSWWATMLSPSGLYLDSSTYIRKEIR